MKKKILITGASSGVGLSLARYLSQTYHVVAAARSYEKMMQEFAGNSSVEPWRLDLSDSNDVEGVLSRILEKHGHFPCLINNAGAMHRADLDGLGQEIIQEALQVNAVSPMLILRRLLPGMKERNYGRVICLTSGAPLNCFPGFGAYSASKAALNAFTVTAARECSGFNVKINLMSPGPVRSAMAPDARLDPSVCHATVDYLLSLGEDGPSGKFFWLGYEIPLLPNLEGVNWLEGKADERYRKVL
jgi:NAD(P)-dependent dehydrogenase (short-subunit alcohol dehydrogenase family)